MFLNGEECPNDAYAPHMLLALRFWSDWSGMSWCVMDLAYIGQIRLSLHVRLLKNKYTVIGLNKVEQVILGNGL